MLGLVRKFFSDPTAFVEEVSISTSWFRIGAYLISAGFVFGLYLAYFTLLRGTTGPNPGGFGQVILLIIIAALPVLTALPLVLVFLTVFSATFIVAKLFGGKGTFREQVAVPSLLLTAFSIISLLWTILSLQKSETAVSFPWPYFLGAGLLGIVGVYYFALSLKQTQGLSWLRTTGVVITVVVSAGALILPYQWMLVDPNVTLTCLANQRTSMRHAGLETMQECISDYAIYNKRPELCQAAGTDSDYCFLQLAFSTANPALCKKITSEQLKKTCLPGWS